MTIFDINDVGKKFIFNGKLYRTPCQIKVNGTKQINSFHMACLKYDIRKLSVDRKFNKQNKTQMKEFPTTGTGSITLSTALGR